MDKFRNYEIAFSGLKEGKHKFQFEVEQAFFGLFGTEQDFTNPKIVAEVLLDKHSTFLEFWLETKGFVSLVCDITNEEFEYPIEHQLKFLVKFAEEYNDDNEEVISVPHGSHAFNISQQIYESVVLAIPMKKISPNASEEDFRLLEQYSPKALNENLEDENQEDSTEIDPRW
ncbi:MAG: DUF177 domain-containing protein, partial [Bergeyella zoohelcum]|nr:DUF177 domain-containing protein [Bergeyella zoohelcum]